MRQRLMGKHDAKKTLESVAGLAAAAIPWHASLVLMPWVTGWEDIDDALGYAAARGARTMRLLLPGFSRLAKVDWQALADIPLQAMERLGAWRCKYPGMPITLEPALPGNLRAEVAGVLAGSPAAGVLQPGDEVVTVNGKAPFSRVDAFYSLYNLANPTLTVCRRGEEFSAVLEKSARSSPGVVMDRDLDSHDLARALAMAGEARRVLMLTSSWALPLWRRVVPAGWEVRAVSSGFFGGNIAAAGLLTVQDYRLALRTDLSGFERILLPPVSFDRAGLDLCGADVGGLARQIPIPLSWT